MGPKYTPRQEAYLRGEIPDEKITANYVERLIKRAELFGDTEVAKRLKPVLERKLQDPYERHLEDARRYNRDHAEERKEYDRKAYEKKHAYRMTHFTPKQEALLASLQSGLMSPKDTTLALLTRTLKKAKEIGRTDVVAWLEPMREKRAKEIEEERPAKMRQRYHDNKAGVQRRAYHRHKQPTTTLKKDPPNTYTDRQKAIIRGEVPFEQTHGNEYVGIRNKAIRRGDDDIVALMDSLREEKKNDATERGKQRAYDRTLEFREDGEPVYKNRWYLSSWEKGVLDGVVDLDECSLDHLFHMRDVCARNDDKERRLMAELLIIYKSHPEVLYHTKSHDEAIAKIRELTFLPIPDPREWAFSDDDDDDNTEEI